MNREIIKIMGLLPTNSEGNFISVGDGNTMLSFTHPERSKVYMSILKLMLDGEARSVHEIYSRIPGAHRSTKTRWANHSILTALVAAGYIEKLPKWKYQLTGRGLAYYLAVTAA